MSDAPRLEVLTPEAMKKLHVVSTATLTSQLLKRGVRNTFIARLLPLWPPCGW